ncbi:MAG: DUF262 domain-containing protein [Crocosphaera sp.]|uniref:DUF262 domain-containing protein n=1 Tax=Crocosphaera sp. TaxID=2729996 RepID=UPI00258AD21D|nr:DUF262 domain-containing protein [Crocosphaera sp.]MCH2246559.1 DUF262 domain-containing protein [Crocosphaera sp.]
MNLQSDVIKQQEMIETAIREGRKKVDYNTVEYPLEFFIEKISQEQVNDQLKWDTLQQSYFIESLLMGLPILNLVMDSDENIIDGKQRLYTTINFVNGNFKLENLKQMPSLNGFHFQDLLLSRQRKFKRLSAKIIVLSESSDVSYCLDGDISKIIPLEEKKSYDKLFSNASHEDLFKLLKPFNQTGGYYEVTITFYDRNSGQMNFKIDGGNERWKVKFDSLSEAMGKAQEIIDELNPKFQEVWDDWNTKDDDN